MPANPKNKFTDNEKILCYHGPLLYEAKTVKSRKDPHDAAKIQYLVHYQGWNKNWDEWVPESRILKMNQENLDRKEKLSSSVASAKKDKKKRSLPGGPGLGLGPPSTSPGPGSVAGSSSKGGKSDSASNSRASTPVSDPPAYSSSLPPPASRAHKRVMDDERSTSSREEDPTPSKRQSSASLSLATSSKKANFNIPIPEELKFVLVSDWDLVNHKKHLFNLPAKSSVSDILGEYQKHIEKAEKGKRKTCTEVMVALKGIFNTLLCCRLLYSIEKKQYSDVMTKFASKAPCEIYGSAHLLRLMVKLNPFLNETSVSEDEDVALIETIISDFLSYLETHRQRFFTSKNYVVAPEGYLKSAL